MKIAIITMTGYDNIGNRLQNFAVQNLLEKRGHQTTTLHIRDYDNYDSFSNNCKRFVKNILGRTGFYSSKLFLVKIRKTPKRYLLKKFDDKYINTTRKYFFKVERMNKFASDFDYYCAGSDQVWTPCFVQDQGFMFMRFADSNKTFSFSASMGNTYIPKQYEQNYIDGFNHVGNISVRETDLQNLIKKMTGRESTVLLDPTLLVDKDQWIKMAKAPEIKTPQKYVATYFLSETTPAQKKLIEKYATDNGLEVIDLLGSYNDHIGPLEFLYLLSNAEFVFTDSFHGTAFSIIFDKKFMVFQRNNTADMSSRITTILKTFKLEEFFVNTDNKTLDDTLLQTIQKIKNTDISHTKAVFMLEKERCNQFLNEVFKN